MKVGTQHQSNSAKCIRNCDSFWDGFDSITVVLLIPSHIKIVVTRRPTYETYTTM